MQVHALLQAEAGESRVKEGTSCDGALSVIDNVFRIL